MHEQTSHDTAGWPTTLRFSRRLGDAVRGADYAIAIEAPPRRRPFGLVLMRRLCSALGLADSNRQRVGLATRTH